MDAGHGALARMASSNFGVFTGADVAACGLTEWSFARLMRSGWCVAVAVGVYRVVAVADSPEQDLAAALAFHEGSVASHRSAARLWRIPGFEPMRPEITLERRRNHRSPMAKLHSSTWLPETHLSRVHGLPATTVARTLFDLAGLVPVGRLERAVDHALVRRLCGIGDLERVHFALARRGRRGSAAFRQILEDRGQGYVAPASELERTARALFAEAGLPPSEYEVDLGGAGWVGRVDCLWRAARLVVELDGRRYHEGRTAREDDRRRDNELMALGWRVLRFTWDDLRDRPHQVVAQIRAALAAPR
jgi:hypothetical protein